MLARTRLSVPEQDGELLVEPSFVSWPEVLRRNIELAETWGFSVAGRPARSVRELARRDALSFAAAFSARLGVPVRAPLDADHPIVMTGHQPDIYHPGVWVKNFLVQRLADETGGTPLDIVVDTDGFETVSVTSPCRTPRFQRCTQHLAVAGQGACFACSPVPSLSDIDNFRTATDHALASLPAPSMQRRFAEFCHALVESAQDAENLAELMTFARRRYESAAGTDYLELPVTSLVRGEAFATLVVDLAFDAERFASAYNSELAEYRADNRIRTQAQPFPDLGVSGDRVELPLWSVHGGKRTTLWAEKTAAGVRLLADERTVVELSGPSEAAIAGVMATADIIAPKALALTLFVRLFCSDLFIHGVGGGRYDRVTDGVCRRYFGIEPPDFGVASLTMHLPLGEQPVSEKDVAEAKERLSRLEHNPDALLSEVSFGTEPERRQALSLAAEKAQLVERISQPDADKKALGAKIRDVNRRLAEMLEPLRDQYASQLAEFESRMEASEVLEDRTYPFCYWSPEEIAEKTR